MSSLVSPNVTITILTLHGVKLLGCLYSKYSSNLAKLQPLVFHFHSLFLSSWVPVLSIHVPCVPQFPKGPYDVLQSFVCSSNLLSSLVLSPSLWIFLLPTQAYLHLYNPGGRLLSVTIPLYLSAIDFHFHSLFMYLFIFLDFLSFY